MAENSKIEWTHHTANLWWGLGGESGTKRRPYDLNWGRSLREQCKDLGIPFFFKQVDKVIAIPDDLLIREFY